MTWRDVTLLAHVVLALAVLGVILSRRRASAVSLAWIVLVVYLPFAGALLYGLIGDPRLSRIRRARMRALPPDPPVVLPPGSGAPWEGIQRTAAAAGAAPLRASGLTLLEGAAATFAALLADVRAARRECRLEFYIWSEGGLADELGEALLEAAARGVACRVLLDSVGSAPFWRGHWPQRLRSGGIRVAMALPARFLLPWTGRYDVRLHRKLALIDDSIAYAGSMNLVDPRFFKQSAGVGEWLDAMARIEGPAVAALTAMFELDWALESGGPVDLPGLSPTEDWSRGPVLQVVPSGPGENSQQIVETLLEALFMARHEIVVTTPYFIPDDAVMAALRSAARRGVDVRLIVPRQVDSRLVQYASHSYFDELLDSGVRILLFDGALLHTKSLTVDGVLAFFGSHNLDLRSLRVNFEASLVVVDPGFCALVRALQARYEASCDTLDAKRWQLRPRWVRMLENLVNVASPLL